MPDKMIKEKCPGDTECDNIEEFKQIILKYLESGHKTKEAGRRDEGATRVAVELKKYDTYNGRRWGGGRGIRKSKKKKHKSKKRKISKRKYKSRRSITRTNKLSGGSNYTTIGTVKNPDGSEVSRVEYRDDKSSSGDRPSPVDRLEPDVMMDDKLLYEFLSDIGLSQDKIRALNDEGYEEYSFLKSLTKDDLQDLGAVEEEDWHNIMDKITCIKEVQDKYLGEHETGNKLYCNLPECREYGKYEKLENNIEKLGEEIHQKTKYFTEQEIVENTISINEEGLLMYKGEILDHSAEFWREMTPGGWEYPGVESVQKKIAAELGETGDFEEFIEDKSWMIFVLTTDKRLVVYEKYHNQYNKDNENDLIQHSSLSGGGSVLAAGYLYVLNGIIKKISLISGHYADRRPAGACNLMSFLNINGILNDDILIGLYVAPGSSATLTPYTKTLRDRGESFSMDSKYKIVKINDIIKIFCNSNVGQYYPVKCSA